MNEFTLVVPPITTRKLEGGLRCLLPAGPTLAIWRLEQNSGEDGVLGSQGSCNLSAIFLRYTICCRSASRTITGSSFRADEVRSRSGLFVLGSMMRGRASAGELRLNADIGPSRAKTRCGM